MVGIDSYLFLGVIGMSDQTNTDLREQVRSRYAAAARAVLAEMFRVLVPGGRIGITDVVAEDHLTPADRAAAGSYVGCIAGALSRAEYLDGLTAAGFTDPSVTFTTEAAPGLHSAIIRAVKPGR